MLVTGRRGREATSQHAPACFLGEEDGPALLGAEGGGARMRPGAGPLAGEVQCWKQGSRAQLPQTESGPRTGVLGTPGAPGTPGARAGMERRVSTDCLRADNLDLRSLYYPRSRDRPWKKCF